MKIMKKILWKITKGIKNLEHKWYEKLYFLSFWVSRFSDKIHWEIAMQAKETVVSL